MGGKQSKQRIIQNIDWNSWRPIGTHRQTIDIMTSSKGQGQAELNNVPLDPKRTVQKQLDIYQYRQEQDNALVKSYGARLVKQKGKTMCGNGDYFKVLTQRIPTRWGQLPQITFPQSIYALCESFRGYRDCYTKIGSFDVTDQMIGVNPQGQVKVWLNENFGENHPSNQKPVIQTTSRIVNVNSKTKIKAFDQNTIVGSADQQQMIENIINIIQRKNQNGQFPSDFRSRLADNANSFDKSLKAVQIYSRERNIFVPDRLMRDSGIPINQSGVVQAPLYNSTNQVSSASLARLPVNSRNDIHTPVFYSSPGMQTRPSNIIRPSQQVYRQPQINFNYRPGNSVFYQQSIQQPRSSSYNNRLSYY